MPSTPTPAPHPISEGDTVQIARGGTYMIGTVLVTDDDRHPGQVRVTVAGDDYLPTPRTRDTFYWGTPGDDVVTLDDDTTPATQDDTGTDAGVLGDTVTDSGWTRSTLDDGSILWTNPYGRTVTQVSRDHVAPNGIPAGISYGTRGVQGSRSIPRVDVDGNPWVLGCKEDVSGVATCIVCGQTTSVRKFPTDGPNRLNVHRPCNSARLASAQGVRRGRTDMAN